jgi:hypothetical protein
MATEKKAARKNKWERLFSFSALSLIAANLFPLFGALFLDWSVFLIIFLFWTENLVIGFFNIFKLIFAQGEGRQIARKISIIPFFLIHYGGFCAGHGVFVISVFGRWANADLKNFHNFIQDIFIDEKAAYAVAALFVSHGLSFIYNYILKGERKKATIHKLMTAPYSRIFILHLTLILGAFLVTLLKTPEAGLALLILLKIGFDLSAHLKERSRFAVMKK